MGEVEVPSGSEDGDSRRPTLVQAKMLEEEVHNRVDALNDSLAVAARNGLVVDLEVDPKTGMTFAGSSAIRQSVVMATVSISPEDVRELGEPKPAVAADSPAQSSQRVEESDLPKTIRELIRQGVVRIPERYGEYVLTSAFDPRSPLSPLSADEVSTVSEAIKILSAHSR